LPEGPQAIKVRQYGRLEGELELPDQVIVKGVLARVMDGAVVKSTQSVKL
jgi:hypothetical protein